MPCDSTTFRAVCGSFVAVLAKILSRRAKAKAAMRTPCVRVSSGLSALALLFLIATLLHQAGDVELNPGPDTTTDTAASTTTTTDQVSLNKILDHLDRADRRQSQMTDTLTKKLDAIGERFQTLETKLTDRLQAIEDNIQTVNEDIDSLSLTIDKLEEENDCLKREMRKQTERLEIIDNENRRQNLVFHNVPKQTTGEWEQCGRVVQDIISGVMKISTDVVIDRAHRVGSAIVVRFQNFRDKQLVLRNAFKLKSHNRRGQNIGLSEDFSDLVREKRRGLMDLYRQYRKDDKEARLRFDRLETEDGVFTFDTQTGEIQKAQTATRLNATQRRSTETATKTKTGHTRRVEEGRRLTRQQNRALQTTNREEERARSPLQTTNTSCGSPSRLSSRPDHPRQHKASVRGSSRGASGARDASTSHHLAPRNTPGTQRLQGYSRAVKEGASNTRSSQAGTSRRPNNNKQ